MFQDITAWFSASVDESNKKLWRDNGGTETDFESAKMIFSSDNTCADTERIYNSKDYQNEHLAVFHSRYISDSARAGSNSKVVLGKYYLPPPDIVALVKSQMTFCWEAPSAGSSSASQTQSKSSAIRQQSTTQTSRPTSSLPQQRPVDTRGGRQQDHTQRITRTRSSPQQQQTHTLATEVQQGPRSRSSTTAFSNQNSAAATDIRHNCETSDLSVNGQVSHLNTVPGEAGRKRSAHGQSTSPQVSPLKRGRLQKSSSSSAGTANVLLPVAGAAPVTQADRQVHTTQTPVTRADRQAHTAQSLGRGRNELETQNSQECLPNTRVVIADVHHSPDVNLEASVGQTNIGNGGHSEQMQEVNIAGTSYCHISCLAKVTGPLYDFTPGQNGCEVYLRPAR